MRDSQGVFLGPLHVAAGKNKNRFLHCNNREPPRPLRARCVEDSGSKKHSEITVGLWAVQRTKNPCVVNPPRQRRHGGEEAALWANMWANKWVLTRENTSRRPTRFQATASHTAAAAVLDSYDVQIHCFLSRDISISTFLEDFFVRFPTFNPDICRQIHTFYFLQWKNMFVTFMLKIIKLYKLG